MLGSRVQGGYVEVAYDVMTLVAPGGQQSLSPFFRYEALRPAPPRSRAAKRDPTLDQRWLVAGLTYKPIHAGGDQGRLDAEGRQGLAGARPD